MKQVLRELAMISWADRRAFMNAARHLPKHPIRFVSWIVYIFVVLLLGYLRLHFAGAAVAQLQSNDYLAIGLLFIFGVTLIPSGYSSQSFYRRPIEARAVTSAPLHLWICSLYLQIRSALAIIPRTITSLIYVFILSIPKNITWPYIVTDLVALMMLVFTISLLPLPLELGPRSLRYASIALGWCALAIAATSGIQSLMLGIAHAPLRIVGMGVVPQLHPGVVVSRLAAGDPLVALGCCATMCLALLALAWVSHGAYPELYEASLASWEFRERLRRSRTGQRETSERVQNVQSSQTLHSAGGRLRFLPRGEGIFLWVDWLTFTRRCASFAIVSTVVISAIVGYALGRLGLGTSLQLHSVEILLITSTSMFGAVAGAEIGNHLRRPIFWLARPSLSVRLAVLLGAGFWRMSCVMLIGVGGALAAGTDVHDMFEFLAIVIGGMILQRGIGLATFAIFPRQLDQRGPALLARSLLMVLLMMPPVVCGIVIHILFRPHNTVRGIIGGVGCALIETLLLTVFSAWRLRRRLDVILSGQ